MINREKLITYAQILDICLDDFENVEANDVGMMLVGTFNEEESKETFNVINEFYKKDPKPLTQEEIRLVLARARSFMN